MKYFKSLAITAKKASEPRLGLRLGGRLTLAKTAFKSPFNYSQQHEATMKSTHTQLTLNPSGSTNRTPTSTPLTTLNVNDQKQTSLAATYEYDNQTFINTIKSIIPESNYLEGDTQISLATPSATGQLTTHFYGLTKPEAIRAFAGLLSFKDGINGDNKAYEHFVNCQKQAQNTFPDPEKAVLTKASFDEMSRYIKTKITNIDDLSALTWSILCNDLLKSTALKAEYFKNKENKPASEDIMLGRLITQLPEQQKNQFFPGLMKLKSTLQASLASGYLSACDPSEAMQGGFPMASWLGLKELDLKSLMRYILHSIFDVAGAAAHIRQPNEPFSIGSATMHEHTWQFFYKFSQLVETFHTQNAKLEDVYNAYLSFRGDYVGIKNDSPENTALIRIICMARIATKEKANLLKEAWKTLDNELKNTLITELNVPGHDNVKRAIFVPWCADIFTNPQVALLKQFMQEAQAKSTPLTPDQISLSIKEGLRIALINMAKIFKATRPLIDSKNTTAKPYVAFCPAIAHKLSLSPYETLNMTFEADGKATTDENGIPRRSALKLVGPQLVNSLGSDSKLPSAQRLDPAITPTLNTATPTKVTFWGSDLGTTRFCDSNLQPPPVNTKIENQNTLTPKL